MTKPELAAACEEIRSRAEATFGSAFAAQRWLHTENPLLSATPLSLMETEAGAAKVRRVLGSLDLSGIA